MEFCYKAPSNEQLTSMLTCDSMGIKKYEPIINNDKLNIQYQKIIQIWRANIDYQPVISRELVLKYIAMYIAKAERRLEICTNMLSRMYTNQQSNTPKIKTYKKFIVEIIAEQDVGA